MTIACIILWDSFPFNIFATVVHKNLKMAKQQTEVFDIFWNRNILLSFIFDDTLQQTDIQRVV